MGDILAALPTDVIATAAKPEVPAQGGGAQQPILTATQSSHYQQQAPNLPSTMRSLTAT